MTKKPQAPKGKGTVKAWANYLTASRDHARSVNGKKGVKMPYADKGADYLTEALAKVMTLAPITEAEARDGKNTVTVDMRKVVRHVTPNLWKRPDITLLQRVAVIKGYAPAVKVAWVRHLSSPKHPNCRDGHEDAYKVILYRTK